VNEKNGCVARWGCHLNIVEHFAKGRGKSPFSGRHASSGN
jgi:hypothetical protein